MLKSVAEHVEFFSLWHKFGISTKVCCPCAVTVLYKYCPNCLVCFTDIPSRTEKEWKNSLWLFRFCERVTQQKPPWIGGILESSLTGPGWRFHVFVFLLYNSHQSLLPHVPDIGTYLERPPASLAVHQDGSQKGSSFYRKPTFVPCHRKGRGGACWAGERGKTGRLIGDAGPEGTLTAFLMEKTTDSECLLAWQTRAPRGVWVKRARMAKDMSEWGQ